MRGVQNQLTETDMCEMSEKCEQLCGERGMNTWSSDKF